MYKRCPTVSSTAAVTKIDDQILQQMWLGIAQDWDSYCVQNEGDSSVLNGLRAEASSLLLFALSPVQEFIESSRSLRDLWSSSLIISKLVDQTLKAIEGEAFVVFPASRIGNVTELNVDNLGEIASTPHRFLAIVPQAASCESLTLTQFKPPFFHSLRRILAYFRSSFPNSICC